MGVLMLSFYLAEKILMQVIAHTSRLCNERFQEDLGKERGRGPYDSKGCIQLKIGEGWEDFVGFVPLFIIFQLPRN